MASRKRREHIKRAVDAALQGVERVPRVREEWRVWDSINLYPKRGSGKGSDTIPPRWLWISVAYTVDPLFSDEWGEHQGKYGVRVAIEGTVHIESFRLRRSAKARSIQLWRKYKGKGGYRKALNDKQKWEQESE